MADEQLLDRYVTSTNTVLLILLTLSLVCKPTGAMTSNTKMQIVPCCSGPLQHLSIPSTIVVSGTTGMESIQTALGSLLALGRLSSTH